MSSSSEDQARHPIAIVAERTGLSPDLLRIWERRYGAVRPARDAAGQRLYSDADVERLRLLRRAVAPGRSISKVARLPTAELARLVAEDLASRAPAAEPVGVEFDFAAAESLCAAVDADGLAALLRRSLALAGLPAFMDSVAAPLMRRVGEAWFERRLSPAQEHLATMTVERVLASGMDALGAGSGGPVLVLGTPAGEQHAVGALLAAAATLVAGWRVVYLGPDLPAEEIACAALASEARAVGLSVVYVPDPGRLVAELTRVRALLPPGVPLLAGGAGADALGSELCAEGIEVMTLAELRAALTSRLLEPAF